MSSKRPRHALSDGRASPEVEQVKIQIPPEVANQLVAEFELYLQRLPPGESEQRIACLFAAKDPQRYAELKGEWGRACSKGAWSNIADVKDHLKRSHSSKYGCIYCGKRFHCRDNQLKDKRKTHEEKECNWHPPLAFFQPGNLDPDLMGAEQEDRVLNKISFNKKEYKHLKLDLENQGWALVEGIWPGTPKGSFIIWASRPRRKEAHLQEMLEEFQGFLDSLAPKPAQQHHQPKPEEGDCAKTRGNEKEVWARRLPVVDCQC